MYEVEEVEVTVDQVIDAANKNGYIHCRGGWFKNSLGFSPNTGFDGETGTEDRPIVEACIMGQIALNLGVDFYSLEARLNELGNVSNQWLQKRNVQAGGNWNDPFGIASAAIEYNDGSKLSYNAIARKLVGWLEPYRGKTMHMNAAKYIAKRKGE